MRQRQTDKRYRDGVDMGRMATQSLPLPVKKDFKPTTKEEPKKTVIKTESGETHIIPFEILPKQIQKHVMAKMMANRSKNKIKRNIK